MAVMLLMFVEVSVYQLVVFHFHVKALVQQVVMVFVGVFVQQCVLLFAGIVVLQAVLVRLCSMIGNQ